MSQKLYLTVTACIFSLIAVVHVVRIVEGWSVQVGPWAAPMWVSWLGIVITASLAIWAFTLATKDKR